MCCTTGFGIDKLPQRAGGRRILPRQQNSVPIAFAPDVDMPPAQNGEDPFPLGICE